MAASVNVSDITVDEANNYEEGSPLHKMILASQERQERKNLLLIDKEIKIKADELAASNFSMASFTEECRRSLWFYFKLKNEKLAPELQDAVLDFLSYHPTKINDAFIKIKALHENNPENPQIATILAWCYFLRQKNQEEIQKARDLLIKGSELNYLPAVFGMAYFLNYLRICDSEFAICVKPNFLQAAEGEYPPALYHVGMFYLRGDCLINENRKLGIEYLQKAANLGHDLAQWELANCYASGEGVFQSPQQALNRYLMAADMGYAKAEFTVGAWYMKGSKELTKDPMKGFEYLRRAALQGNVEAQAWVANCYLNGEGVGQNKLLGFRYLQNCVRDSAYASHLFAECRLKGDPCTANTGLALDYFKKAAEAGYVESLYSIANIYFTSDEFRNEALGCEYLRRASDKGHLQAKYALALRCMKGEGVPVDLNFARMLLTEAYKAGMDVAGIMLKNLGEDASPKQSSIDKDLGVKREKELLRSIKNKQFEKSATIFLEILEKYECQMPKEALQAAVKRYLEVIFSLQLNWNKKSENLSFALDVFRGLPYFEVVNPNNLSLTMTQDLLILFFKRFCTLEKKNNKGERGAESKRKVEEEILLTHADNSEALESNHSVKVESNVSVRQEFLMSLWEKLASREITRAKIIEQRNQHQPVDEIVSNFNFVLGAYEKFATEESEKLDAQFHRLMHEGETCDIALKLLEDYVKKKKITLGDRESKRLTCTINGKLDALKGICRVRDEQLKTLQDGENLLRKKFTELNFRLRSSSSREGIPAEIEALRNLLAKLRNLSFSLIEPLQELETVQKGIFEFAQTRCNKTLVDFQQEIELKRKSEEQRKGTLEEVHHFPEKRKQWLTKMRDIKLTRAAWDSLSKSEKIKRIWTLNKRRPNAEIHDSVLSEKTNILNMQDLRAQMQQLKMTLTTLKPQGKESAEVLKMQRTVVLGALSSVVNILCHLLKDTTIGKTSVFEEGLTLNQKIIRNIKLFLLKGARFKPKNELNLEECSQLNIELLNMASYLIANLSDALGLKNEKENAESYHIAMESVSLLFNDWVKEAQTFAKDHKETLKDIKKSIDQAQIDLKVGESLQGNTKCLYEFFIRRKLARDSAIFLNSKRVWKEASARNLADLIKLKKMGTLAMYNRIPVEKMGSAEGAVVMKPSVSVGVVPALPAAAAVAADVGANAGAGAAVGAGAGPGPAVFVAPIKSKSDKIRFASDVGMGL